MCTFFFRFIIELFILNLMVFLFFSYEFWLLKYFGFKIRKYTCSLSKKIKIMHIIVKLSTSSGENSREHCSGENKN